MIMYFVILLKNIITPYCSKGLQVTVSIGSLDICVRACVHFCVYAGARVCM